ncbi:hypothetical protein CRYUN_Cryun22dG0061700 [Craigia yunnanensis]
MDKGLFAHVDFQHFLGPMARIAGPSFKELSFKTSLYNSSVLLEHNSVICYCYCSGKRPLRMETGLDVRLLAVAYCGIAVTGVTFYLQAWVIEKKGPVFLAMSTPLNLIFTIFCSAFLLCEMISLGSLVGGLLLIGGLYSVLWGKTREQRMLDENCLPAHVDKECR